METNPYRQKIQEIENRISQIDRELGMICSAMRLPQVKEDKGLRSACDRQLNELHVERNKLTPVSMFWQRLYQITPGA
jgi:hypothetical protein